MGGHDEVTDVPHAGASRTMNPAGGTTFVESRSTTPRLFTLEGMFFGMLRPAMLPIVNETMTFFVFTADSINKENQPNGYKPFG